MDPQTLNAIYICLAAAAGWMARHFFPGLFGISSSAGTPTHPAVVSIQQTGATISQASADLQAIRLAIDKVIPLPQSK